MWSMCSIETGHASTHAPHVTQSQIDLLRHAVADDRPRILREHLVAHAHDQELRREDLPRRVRGACVLAATALGAREPVHDLLLREVEDRRRAEAQLIVRHVEAQRLEPPGPARAREPHVDRRRRDVQMLRVRQVAQEAEHDREVRPDEALAPSDRCSGTPSRGAPRAARRDRSGPPRALRHASRAASRRRPRSATRMTSASPRCEPRNRAGRTTFRITTAVTIPTSTSTLKRSTIQPNHVWPPSQGSSACLSTAAIIAMTIVGKSTRKPQKMNACISPGTRRCRSFRWPSTISTSFLTAAADVRRPVVRLRPPNLLGEEGRAGATRCCRRRRRAARERRRL